MKGRVNFFFSLIFFASLCNLRAQGNRIPELDSPQHLPPEVNFGWTHACYGDTTKFFNATLRGGTYQWYVFDKLMDTLYRSTNTNISFYFPTADTFYVFLQSDNGHITNLQDTLIIGNNLKAGFSFMHCSNIFLNQSSCATSYSWDFGDGNTSTDSIPVHEYADTGKYVVTFVAHNGIATDTLRKLLYVTVVGFANPSFALNLSNDTLYYQISNYTPHSNIYWGFGDGGTSNSQQGYYVYTASGSYNIYLNQTNGCGITMHDTTLQVSVPAGIDALSFHSELKVVPNPSADGIFSILSNEQINSIIVTDVFGNDILNIPFNTDKINLSGCASGQYILKAIGSNKTYIGKLIKQ